MSDAVRQLKADAREVQNLCEDVYAPVFARQEWRSNVLARRSLGDGMQVEAWYLAEHFLLAWNDWHGLCGRYLGYFGQRPERLPRSWNTLHMRCKGLAERILRDERLDEIVHHEWLISPFYEALMGDNTEPSTRSVYHAMVINHRRLDLLHTALSWEDGTAEKSEQAVSRKQIWPRWLEEARQFNGALMKLWHGLPRQVREPCLWHLRPYQHANLLMSWLANQAAPSTQDGGATVFRLGDGRGDGEGGDGRGGGRGDGSRPAINSAHRHSALLQILEEKIVNPSIDDYLGHLQDADLRSTASQVLSRISQAIGEIGYDEFVADVTSNDFRAGDDSALGSSEINLIPGGDRGTCRSVLVAVSKGEKKAIGFQNVMRQVREHLIECWAQTRLVIVLCDQWTKSMLDEHIRDVQAHHRRGVQFVFLMATPPGNVLTPVAVDLSKAA